jgi:hypothetical protein
MSPIERSANLRLPAEMIKRAILHPDSHIREMAVHYFADAHARDISIMPLVIETLEQHGKDDAYMLVGAAVALNAIAHMAADAAASEAGDGPRGKCCLWRRSGLV